MNKKLNLIKIPFNIASLTGNELKYVAEAYKYKHISGDGVFTKKCSEFIEKKFNISKVLLTTSGSTALDMTALLLNLKPGDEVIVPSYTFSSTVNAFVLRGAKPIFVDINKETLNMDENLIEKAVTKKTKAIYIVDYAGISSDINKIKKIAKKFKLPIVEDAAQGINAKYKNKYLGTFGDLAIYSFHETKNYSCGEGGALLINNPKYFERAEIIREKGTDRSKFFRGQVNKYGWVDIGSSFLLSEILAAILYAQLENLDKIQKKREALYQYYYKKLKFIEKNNNLKLPIIPKNNKSNFHIFYILLPTGKIRDNLMAYLKSHGILAVFHYLPLHSSKMGKKFKYHKEDLPITEDISERLLRLPFYYSLSKKEQDIIIYNLKNFFDKSSI